MKIQNMIPNNFLVSIVVPNYNCEDFVDKAIDSVIEQTYDNWEMIIVDDCSTDNSVEIIKQRMERDSRIQLIKQTNNQGAGMARNVGIMHSRGTFIAFLDADDIWYDQKLEFQISSMLENGHDATCSWYRNIDDRGNGNTMFKVPSKITFNKLKFNNYVLTSTLIYKKSAAKNVLFSSIRKRQDWIFFLDLLRNVKSIQCVDKCLVSYRKRKGSLSSNKLVLIKANLKVISNYFYKGNMVFSFFHFLVFLLFYFHNKIFFLRQYNKKC
jgi:glycosyltransferase involved in cell wall biosynthesis